MALPWWTLFVLAAAARSWISVTVLVPWALVRAGHNRHVG